MFRQFFRHVIPAILRPLRILWNEVIAFLFFVLALFGGFRAYKEAQADASPVTVVIPLLWTAVMGFFAVTSFLKARKIGRS